MLFNIFNSANFFEFDFNGNKFFSFPDISTHMTEVNKHKPKHLILPPSTFIDVVLELIKNIYWEAKRARGMFYIKRGVNQG